MTDDRIEYSLKKLTANDPFKGGTGDRFEIALTNLTADECGAVAMALLDMQNARLRNGVCDITTAQRAADQFIDITKRATA